jgi:hypothetical protein
MADIYLSYSKWDRTRIAPIVALLEREGWSVWRDTRVGAGEAWDDTWDEKAASEASAAACIVVAWSVSAIESDWVRTEARAGFERGILVPVLIEQATPPHRFAQIPAADLSGWKGDADAPEARAFVEAVRKTAGVPGLWAAAKSARGAPEIEHWESVQASLNPADFENFLSLHPKGPLADPARARLEQLQLHDDAPTRPAPTSGTARLWLLAAALLAVAGASTWYTLDLRRNFPGLEMPAEFEEPSQSAPETETPPSADEPAPPAADLPPSPSEPAVPPDEKRDVYKPFGEKTKGCPTEELACRGTPGCAWWAAFNICVVQEPGANAETPQEQTVAPPPPPVPQCPADEATCRATTVCEWVDYFKACLPRPPGTTEQAPAEAPVEAPPEVPDCSSIEDQDTCGAETACEWAGDQCLEKPLAPQ